MSNFVITRFNKIKKLLKREPKITGRMVRSLAFQGRDIVRKSMKDSPPNFERVYFKGGKRFNPSLPGNPPRIALGILEAGIQVTKIKDRKYAIVSLAPYSRDLELGTDNIAPRPFMAPMAMKLAKMSTAFIKANVNYITIKDLA